MRKLLMLPSLAAFVFAGTAAAASGPTVSISLQPHKAKKNSALTVTASGFPAESSLPSSVELQVQKGFKTSPKSVKQLCNPTASSCPAASKIGTGNAQATGTVPILGNVSDTVNFTLYLGRPQQRGDLASVILTGTDTALHQTLSATGRLFKDSAGGLELLFNKFPSLSGLPPGTTVTLNSLSFTASATRTVKKKVKRHHKKVTVKTVYSLITNPSNCRGSWTGSATIAFPSGATTVPLSTPCKK
jgi:hypothetical protein